MASILETNEQVKGEIYVITNKISGKKYIGQTLTHRKNKNKYRPYGYEKRFKTHISDALCNTKKSQSRCLADSLRKQGSDAFIVELIKECEISELDNLEIHYINYYNTLHPNGYNLTIGGKNNVKCVDTSDMDPLITKPPRKIGGCEFRSEETKTKMKQSLAIVMNTQDMKEKIMKNTQKQHEEQKYEKFKNVSIDKDNLEQYIRNRTSSGIHSIRVKIGKLQTDFVGKHQTIEELKNRAIQFLQSI